MTLIALQGIDKLFGGTRVLHDLGWSVEEEARVGLVGANGSGKSTILRIMAGLEEVSGGEITRKKGLRQALLPQHVPSDERSPLALALASRPDLEALEARLASCEARLSEPDVFGDPNRIQRVLEEQERLVRRYGELGGPGFEGEARSYFLDLGLEENDLGRPMKHLSGGQRKIAMLAVCLAQRPDLLLLDEPETHLDLVHREMLEQLVRRFEGAVVIVSHDRYLLDETVSSIAELENARIRLWSGNYSAYAVARQLALLRQQELYVTQQKEIQRLEEAIKRFQLWASMVVDERHIRQARVKQRQIDQMEKVERPVLERRKMALDLRSASRGGQKVFDLTDVEVGFDGSPLLRSVNLTVLRGERVGIIGPNGAGKTVLARILVGELEPMRGRTWRGPSIKVGYFAQGQETLPNSATALDLVRAAHPLTEGQAVSKLLAFLFTYEQVRQPISTLSGGERSRLQLLLLVLSGANCLVLDEPTNHLDIDSAEVLESNIERFDGTALVISHDRYFLDRIVDRIVVIDDGAVRSFGGGYSEWAQRAEGDEAALTARFS
jgi:ATP-binding cassette, subfamily F, member 3